MFGEKIINKIEKGMYNIEKEKAKKLLFGDTSTIVENENNITCYIKRNRIKKIGQDYIIRCNGIGNEERSFAKEFNLDKPVYYVLEGLEFIDGAVQIYGYNNPHVLIDNCNFDLGAHIYVLGECTIDRSFFWAFSKLSITASDLNIKNLCEGDIGGIHQNVKIGIAALNNLNITDSVIGVYDRDNYVSLYAANEISTSNSKVYGKTVKVESKTLNLDNNSILDATESITLNAKIFNPVDVIGPKITVNGEEFINNQDSVLLKQVNDPLSQKRLELISVLSQIKDKCEMINGQRAARYQQELQNESITQIVDNQRKK